MSIFKNKYFYINLIIALALFIAIVIVVLLSLKRFTRHGETIVLPNFEGEPLEVIHQFTKDNKLQYVIIDSIYNDDLVPGTIVLQDPYPNSTVKKGRKIYISIVSSLPESEVMPNVVNLSVRQAVALIYGNNLSVKELVFIEGFDKNAVQRQLYENKDVASGAKLPKNAAITLEVSSGNYAAIGKIPNLKGLIENEAIQKIYQHSFNVGTIIGSKKEGARVASQTPRSTEMTYSLGSKINIGLSVDGKSVWDEEEADSLYLHPEANDDIEIENNEQIIDEF